MRYISSTIVAACLLLAARAAQADEDWVQNYGSQGNGADVLATLAIASDANVFAAGASEDPAGGWNGVLLSVTNEGALSWAQGFDPSPAADDLWNDLAVYSDGGVVVTGLVSEADGTTMATSRYSGTGSEVWSTTTSFQDSGWSEGSTVLALSDGRVVSVGIYGREDASQDVAIVQFDASGNETWSRTWTALPGRIHEIGGAAADGTSLVIAGTVRTIEDTSGATSNVFVLRVDESGVEEWSYLYDSGNGASASALTVSAEGRATVVGQTGVDSSRILALRLAGDGTETWVATWGANDQEAWSQDVALDSAGNTFVVGSRAFTGSPADVVTLKLDDGGAWIWESVYGGALDEQGVAVAVAADDKVYVTSTAALSGGLQGRTGIATVEYDETGSENWAEIYEVADSTSSEALALAVNGFGQVVVGGGNYLTTGAGADIAILTYGGIPAEVGADGTAALPTHVELGQCFPNPARFESSVRYALPESGRVKLSLFDASGRLLRVLQDAEQEAGFHEIGLPVPDLAAGVYFYRMDWGKERRTRKLTVSR